ncbi:MAG: ribonuclease P protein subunit, partial [Methanobrevibacter sp.]|nr:ribonuclease P protein subunit [Methanobrevibacter sp.]
MISSKNIFYHELIGLELKVVDSSNPSLIGLQGTVIDETKKTLLVEVKENVQDKDLSSNQNDFNFIYKEKLIQKDVSVFQFKVPDGT